MGFWSNFSKVFGAKASARQAGQSAGGRLGVDAPAAHRAPAGWVKEGGTPIQATATATMPRAQAQSVAQSAPRVAPTGAHGHASRITGLGDSAVPAQPRMIDPSAPRNAAGELVQPPRTKQELFEELHRNYREVLHLVRKVNTHLDREQARGDRMLRVAAQVEAVLPKLQALTSMPMQINEHASKLHAELVEAMRDTSQSDEVRTRRLESALSQISQTMHEGAEGQANLNRTMAAFRETISDANKDARRSTLAIEELAVRSARREEELMKLLADSKRWSAVGLVMCGVVGLIAIAAGVFAVLVATGKI
jgi:hypothetical protein